MLTHDAVATSNASCEAPPNVSSPKMLTTQAMSATSNASGTHESQREGSRFTLSNLIELLNDRENEESCKQANAHQCTPNNVKWHIPHMTGNTNELIA